MFFVDIEITDALNWESLIRSLGCSTPYTSGLTHKLRKPTARLQSAALQTVPKSRTAVNQTNRSIKQIHSNFKWLVRQVVNVRRTQPILAYTIYLRNCSKWHTYFSGNALSNKRCCLCWRTLHNTTINWLEFWHWSLNLRTGDIRSILINRIGFWYKIQAHGLVICS